MQSRFGLSIVFAIAFIGVVAEVCPALPTVFFNTGDPDGRIGVASRSASPGKIEIEAADDFLLASQTSVVGATFTGLLPSGAPLSDISGVSVSIYRVFPFDSVNPPSGRVPTRANSPSDVAFDSRDSAASTLTFAATSLNSSFTAANSVLNGIHPIPGQTTGGEGPVTGEEVLLSVNFATPFDLPANHYFFVPQVTLTGGDFFWLSAPRPIVAPGTPFSPDLQAWVRDANLDPDWLRVGTDIVGGGIPPTYDMAFSLTTDAVPEPLTASATCLLLTCTGLTAWRTRHTPR